MKQNVGGIDRIARIVLGLALIGFALLGPESDYRIFAWIGIVPLATGLIGWCPAYLPFGLKTCSAK